MASRKAGIVTAGDDQMVNRVRYIGKVAIFDEVYHDRRDAPRVNGEDPDNWFAWLWIYDGVSCRFEERETGHLEESGFETGRNE